MYEQNPPFITIVSGLPRSGTSMMMRMLEAGGMEVMTDHLRQPDPDNPQGYYEFEAVKQTKHDDAWLDQAPGRAVKMVYRLLRDLPPRYPYRVLMMRRHLTEILESQRKMLRRQGLPSDSSGDEKLAALFERQMAECMAWTAAQPNFRLLEVSYNSLLADALPHLTAINEFLDRRLLISAMKDVLSPGLYRNRVS